MPALKRYATSFPPLLWFIPLLLALGFGLYRSRTMPPSDFAGYYFGGQALVHGQYTAAYDMTVLNDRIAAAGYRDALVSYAPFPPFTALLFAPFLAFPMPVAKLVFNMVSILLFLFSLGRLCARLATPPWLIAALPLLFFVPILNNLAFGQSYLLLFTLLAEGWMAHDRSRYILAAACWAAAILFKLFPAFLFLYLLLRRKYRQTVYLAIACVALLALSLWLNGTAAWKYYISVIIPRMGRGELNDSFTAIFQSGYMLFKRAFVYDGLLNPYPVTDSPWLFTIAMAVFKAAIVAIAVRLTVREKTGFFPFAVWVMAAMLVSPNGSSYSLILLLLPMLGLANRAGSSHAPSRAALLAAVVLLTAACAIPVARFAHLPLLLQFPRLYLLLLLYGLFSLRHRPLPRPVLFGVLAILFTAMDIRGNLAPKGPGTYVLPAEAHLFVCGYGVRDHRLYYTWRDEKGLHDTLTGLPVASLTDTGVAIRDNQLWFRGRQLTRSPDQKAKPALVDGTAIYYLSDEARGFEFYTLRRIRPAALPPGGAAAPGSSR